MKNIYIFTIILSFIFLSFTLSAVGKPKAKTNENADICPAIITPEYKKLTLELMKILDYEQGYDMMFNSIITKIQMYEPDIKQDMLKKLQTETYNDQAYKDSLVVIYSKYFSLNDVKFLHKYFTSSTFKKANIFGMKVQDEVEVLLNDLTGAQKKIIADKIKSSGYAVPQFLTVGQENKTDTLNNNK